jgi:tryptophan-rich sensory protein
MFAQYSDCLLKNANGYFHQAIEYKLVFLPILLAVIVGLVFDIDYDDKWYKLLRKPK